MITMTVLLFDRIEYGEGRLGGGLMGPRHPTPHTLQSILSRGPPEGTAPRLAGV